MRPLDPRRAILPRADGVGAGLHRRRDGHGGYQTAMTVRTAVRPIILLLTGPIALGVVLALVAAMLVVHLHGRAFSDAAREQARPARWPIF